MWGKDKNYNAEKNGAEGEGKTFDKDAVFECVTDCKYNGVRYDRGDKVTGRACPPHFKPAEDGEE